MLEALKFVQGAVARKNVVPELTHFRIKDGRVTAYNGSMALSSPIACVLDCAPKAATLIKAIQQAAETAALSITPAGRLRITSGGMKVLVDCIEPTMPPLGPEGTLLPLNEQAGAALLQAFKSVEPFIGDDASRAWANGALMRNGAVYATCNVILVQYWLGFSLPMPVNIPYAAVKEVIRVGEAPQALQYTSNSISFLYSDGRWIRTQLFSTEWPDSIDSLLERPSEAKPIAEGLFEAVANVKNFMDKTGRIIFRNGVVSTHEDDEEGGHYDVPMDFQGVYAYDMFMALNGIATHADFSTWPNPCVFFGNNLRGVIIGRKL